MKATATAKNPLFDKLCTRFSYSGKTVGEMMLSRAREAGYTTEHKPCDLKEMTVESHITRANSLPRAQEAASAVAVRPLFTARRINPCAALAIALFMFILTYLLIAGISHRTPSFEISPYVPPIHEVSLYEAPLVDATQL